jgi:hypothetical protein
MKPSIYSWTLYFVQNAHERPSETMLPSPILENGKSYNLIQ